LGDTVRIALSGYYGCGNLGDEAVLEGIAQSFERRVGLARSTFTVLSADPVDTERRHGMRAVPRMRPGALRNALKDCDLLISGGGSLLQDTTSLRSLLYYLSVVRLAGAFRVRVVFYAQGIGPLRRHIARVMTRMAASRAASITVRDSASAELLREIGVKGPPIEVTADPAFVLRPGPADAARETLRAAGIRPGRRCVGMAVRPWPSSRCTVERWAECARVLSKRLDAEIALIPMHRPGDTELARAIGAASGSCARVIETDLSVSELHNLLACADLVVAMRLHAAILGARAGVPVVAVSYDPKVRQLMQELGQPEANVELGLLEPTVLGDTAERIVADASRVCASLRARSAEMEERALVNVDRALGPGAGRA